MIEVISEVEQMMKVEIYTDGGCSPNPGPGGYGVVLLCQMADGKLHKKELSQGFKQTTNNRMELLSAIVGLKALKKPCHVTLYSDSKYLVDAVNLGWIEGWKKKGWYRKKKAEIRPKNLDLWVQLDHLLRETDHIIEFKWVKGHAGNFYNERCDELATDAIHSGNCTEDNQPSDEEVLGYNQIKIL